MYSNILETRIPLHVFYRISEVSVKPKKLFLSQFFLYWKIPEQNYAEIYCLKNWQNLCKTPTKSKVSSLVSMSQVPNISANKQSLDFHGNGQCSSRSLSHSPSPQFQCWKNCTGGKSSGINNIVPRGCLWHIFCLLYFCP